MDYNHDQLVELVKANQTQILLLNSKVDVLTAFLLAIYLKNGSNREKFYEDFERLTANIAQKYLERIEGQCPRLAADIAPGIDLLKIDQKLLDDLQFGDGS